MGCLSIDGIPPSIKLAGTTLHTRVERHTVRVKCLAQEHNAVPQPGLEPGPLDPESSALIPLPKGSLTNGNVLLTHKGKVG